jgi:hypothetical protein
MKKNEFVVVVADVTGDDDGVDGFWGQYLAESKADAMVRARKFLLKNVDV